MDHSKLMELMRAKKAAMKKTEKTAKLEQGENRVRILPGWRGDEDPTWWHDYGQHFIKDAADQIQEVYLCTHATFEQPCPICQAIADGIRTCGDDDTAKVLEKSKQSKSILVNALMLDSKEPNTPVILEIKRGLFEQLLLIAEEYEGAPLDPVDGMILKITRDGKGLATKYTAMPTSKKYAIPPASLAKLHNLDEYVKQESEEKKRLAIAAVSNIAGILPAPTSRAGSGDVPRTLPSAVSGSRKADDDFADIDDEMLKPAGASGSPAPTLGDDIDDLLSDLPE